MSNQLIDLAAATKSDLSLINRSASEGILSIDEAVTAARSKRSEAALHALDTTIARVRYARLAMDLRVEGIRAEDAPDGFALARARRKLEILARRLDAADDFAQELADELWEGE